MSLPTGVVRRPPVLSPNPAAFGGLVRLALRLFLVTLPFLVLVAGQVSGTNWAYDIQKKREKIASEKRSQQLLRAELAALRCPDRLRNEAERLGLMAAPLSNPPRSLVQLRVPEDSP